MKLEAKQICKKKLKKFSDPIRLPSELSKFEKIHNAFIQHGNKTVTADNFL